MITKKKSKKKAIKRNPLLLTPDLEYQKEYIAEYLLNGKVKVIHRGVRSKTGDLKSYIQVIGKLTIAETKTYGMRYHVISSIDPNCFSTFDIYDISEVFGESKEIILK